MKKIGKTLQPSTEIMHTSSFIGTLTISENIMCQWSEMGTPQGVRLVRAIAPYPQQSSPAFIVDSVKLVCMYAMMREQPNINLKQLN